MAESKEWELLTLTELSLLATNLPPSAAVLATLSRSLLCGAGTLFTEEIGVGRRWSVTRLCWVGLELFACSVYILFILDCTSQSPWLLSWQS